MKHTYLYPLRDGELWLWRAARMDATDLFGSPDADTAPDVEGSLAVGISDALGAARDELHKRIKDRPSICIGRHYVIPDSLCDVAREREVEADQVVRNISYRFWDAAHLHRIPYADTYNELKKGAGLNGRDDWAALQEFLATHRGQRVVPVWK